jgi:chaperone modulatory protein CbpM
VTGRREPQDSREGQASRTLAMVRVVSAPRRMDLESFARRSGLHPDLVRRLVALGLVEATTDASGDWWLADNQLVVAARIQRLRAGFALNYAALGLVIDLLDRIAELESAARRERRPRSRQVG